jgi:hypothetical protein
MAKRKKQYPFWIMAFIYYAELSCSLTLPESTKRSRNFDARRVFVKNLSEVDRPSIYNNSRKLAEDLIKKYSKTRNWNHIPKDILNIPTSYTIDRDYRLDVTKKVVTNSVLIKFGIEPIYNIDELITILYEKQKKPRYKPKVKS